MKESVTRIIVCPSCNGTGWIPNGAGMWSSTGKVCPACHGGGTILEHIHRERVDTEITDPMQGTWKGWRYR